MPNHGDKLDAESFSARLKALLLSAGIKHHGMGAYLQKRYKVSNATASNWLNGIHKMKTALAKKVAEDHHGSFDQLYWGNKPETAQSAVMEPKVGYDHSLWPFSPELLERVMDLNVKQRFELEGAMKLALVQIENKHQEPIQMEARGQLQRRRR